MTKTIPSRPSPWFRLRTTAARCARDAARYARSLPALVGLGALACVACCTWPFLLAAIGLSGASATAAALADGAEPMLFGGAALSAVVLGSVLVVRGAEEASGGCSAAAPDLGEGAACNVDGSCGCASTKPQCTLSAGQTPERARALRDIFAALIAADRMSRRELVLRFRGETAVAERARALAALESECCAFADTAVEVTLGEVRWRWTVPDGAEAALDTLEDLARASRTGLADDAAREMLDRMNEALRR